MGLVWIRKLNEDNIHCRACLAFRTGELVARFGREYDGHIFEDNVGLSFRHLLRFLSSK